MKKFNNLHSFAYLALCLVLFGFSAGETLTNLERMAKPGANNTVLETNASGDVKWTGKNSVFSGGTGVSIAADGTITNDSPDQVVSFTQSGIAVISGTYPGPFNIDVTEVDGSTTNEAQDLTTSGTSSPQIILGTAGGAGGGSVTFTGAGGVTISRSGNTFTIDGSAFGTGTPSFVREVQDLSSNTASVTLSTVSYATADTRVYVDGILMEEGASADFTATSTVLTFNTSLLSGQKVTIEKLIIS